MTSVYSDYATAMAWQRILHAKGWAAPAWPVEYGGCGWSIVQRYIFATETAAAGAPGLSPMGIGMCGPVLIGYGTAEQKAHYCRECCREHLLVPGLFEPGRSRSAPGRTWPNPHRRQAGRAGGGGLGGEDIALHDRPAAAAVLDRPGGAASPWHAGSAARPWPSRNRNRRWSCAIRPRAARR